jgi:hypothetical protein
MRKPKKKAYASPKVQQAFSELEREIIREGLELRRRLKIDAPTRERERAMPSITTSTAKVTPLVSVPHFN